MQDKVVIIIGATGSLGRVVAGAFAAAGGHVVAIDMAPAPPPGFDAVLTERGLGIDGVDLTDPAAAEAAVAKAVDRFGRVDALINIAGGFAWETLAEGSLATWDKLYAINVRTCVNACRAALPHLVAAKGRIVNVGAGGALNAAAGMGAYAAAKSGVHRLTEALAQEQKGVVQVNAVLPSIIDTPQNRADMPKADPATWVQPSELAAIILFLAASPEAAAITGALIPVNGRV